MMVCVVLVWIIWFFFFFSSRRRHTRSYGDWSSDVCSSDLDAGGLDAGFRLAIHEGLITGPRLVLSLGIISPIGGIGDRVSPSGHGSPFVHDPSLPPSVADGIEGVRTTVRTMVRAGADVIKCATTGGASSRAGHGPKDSAFSLDEMRALVDEAHALGRRVMCHAVGGPGLRVAITAGGGSIEQRWYLD